MTTYHNRIIMQDIYVTPQKTFCNICIHTLSLAVAVYIGTIHVGPVLLLYK